MKYQAPRGTYDVLPEDRGYWHHIKKTAARICSAYGYGHIDTPVFEDAGLFVRAPSRMTHPYTPLVFSRSKPFYAAILTLISSF